jgi:hypothetical protein
LVAVIGMKSLRLPYGRQNFMGPFGAVLMLMRSDDQFFLSGKMPLVLFNMAFRFREMLQQRSSSDHLTPHHAADSSDGQYAALAFSPQIYHAVGVSDPGWICLP